MSRYKAVSAGLKELGMSAWMGGQCLTAAQKLASAASTAGDATYGASLAIVHGGHNNEERAGAKVSVTEPHWRDSRDRVLVNITKTMTAGGS